MELSRILVTLLIPCFQTYMMLLLYLFTAILPTVLEHLVNFVYEITEPWHLKSFVSLFSPLFWLKKNKCWDSLLLRLESLCFFIVSIALSINQPTKLFLFEIQLSKVIIIFLLPFLQLNRIKIILIFFQSFVVLNYFIPLLVNNVNPFGGGNDSLDLLQIRIVFKSKLNVNDFSWFLRHFPITFVAIGII